MNKMKKDKIIEVKNLTYSYNKNTPIFQNISFTISKGELVAIIGHNGSGKSTLVKLLLGLLETKSSSISVKGKIAYIPQKFNTDNNFPGKVKEILDLECCECSLREDILKSLGIENLQHLQFKSLSGGQQQRVMIALSLLSNPDILVLDEPAVGVDTKTQNDFYKLLKKLNKQLNITILFVTHDTGMISQYFTTTICVNNNTVCIDDAKNTHSMLHSVYGEEFNQIIHNHNH